jgi:hypothetical protein
MVRWRNGKIHNGMIHDYRLAMGTNFTMAAINKTAPKKIRQPMPNNRTFLLQSLQTGDGHHGALATIRKPMFAHQPTEPRSLSAFSSPQLLQVNIA